MKQLFESYIIEVYINGNGFTVTHRDVECGSDFKVFHCWVENMADVVAWIVEHELTHGTVVEGP